MANEIQDALVGLADILKDTGLRVFPFETDPQQIPALVYVSMSRNPQVVLGSAAFEAVLLMRLYVSKAINEEAMNAVWEYAGPVGQKSVQAAIETDRTWNSTIDTSSLTSVENVGVQEAQNGFRYVGADFTITIMKQVVR